MTPAVDNPFVPDQVEPRGAPLLVPAYAQVPTIFYAPLVSGLAGYSNGQAVLGCRFELDYTLGTFTGGPLWPGAVLTFPPGSILWKAFVLVSPAYNGANSILALGTTPGGVQIANVPLTTAGMVELPASPAFIGPVPANRVYVSQMYGNSTQGHAAVILSYLGAPAAPWR